VQNYFVPKNNGIDVAVLSCDACYFAPEVLCKVSDIEWCAPDSFELASPVWLVHYPTPSSEAHGVGSTHRLDHDCHPTVSMGAILLEDCAALAIDSTIVATGGSSGGLVIDAQGRVVAVHDSQHDETADGKPVSTHRMVRELRQVFKAHKQLCNLLD
jgi:hypothetical protein